MALNRTSNECHVYEDIKLRKKRKGAIMADVCKDVKAAAKALVVSEPMAIFHAGHGKL